MAAPQSISFEWHGETVTVIPTHDLYMQIEDRVSFARLASAFANVAVNGLADVPMSHVGWVVFCALRHARQNVTSPMEVHQVIQSGGIRWGQVIGDLINAYYGATAAKAKIEKKPKAAARNSRR